MEKKQVIDELQKLASSLGGSKIITQKVVRTKPKLSYWISYHFRTLGRALREAKLPASPLASKMSVTNEELLQYLGELQEKKDGRKPTLSDITHDTEIYKKYSSRNFSWSIFNKRFKGFRNALEQLDSLIFNKKGIIDQKDTQNEKSEDSTTFNKKTFFGRAAELQVTAELIYHGFQAGDIPIDEGLDILAVKDNKTYYFQVKHKDFGNNQSVKITKSSYEKTGGGDVYYIFVLLSGEQRKFLIVPYHRINDWKGDGWLSEEEKEYLLRIKEDNTGRFKIINKDGDNELDVTRFIDTWEQIR